MTLFMLNGLIMRKLCILLCTSVLLGLPYLVRAQFVTDYKRTADIYYSKQDYYTAAQYYSKALENKKDIAKNFFPYQIDETRHPSKSARMHEYEELVFRLAESYRQYNDFGSAEKWYAQAVSFNSPEFPLAKYWYGVCLRANGKFAEALTQFQQFKAAYATQDEYQAATDKEIANCQFAVSEMQKTMTPFTVVKLGGTFNEGGANYAPVWWTSQLSFTSSRSTAVAAPKTAGGKDPYINHLYTTPVSNGSTSGTAQRVDLPGQSMEEGVSALSQDGLTMYLTEWTAKDGKKQADLYKCTRNGTAWSEPAKLTGLDIPGYSTMQPAISTDGQTLLFASDRPGGSGKFDIWYATLDANGNPGTPVNMGPTVNTAGDEEAPYYDAGLHVLIFSTNGRVGLGNFDLFESTGDLANLSTPVNLGAPVNSPKDDMYFTSTTPGKKLFKEAYISSDRASSCCLELFKVTRRGKRIGGDVVDCDTHQPISGVKITLIDAKTNKPAGFANTDAGGGYGFELDDPGNYKIKAEKDNYFNKSFDVHSEDMVPTDTLNNPELCLKHYDIGEDHPIVLPNILYDFNKASLRPESKIVLDTLVALLDENPGLTIQMGSHTDGVGSVKYNLNLSELRAKSCVDYLISKGIDPARLKWKGFGKCCPIAPEKLPNGKDNPDGRQTNRRTEFAVLRKN